METKLNFHHIIPQVSLTITTTKESKNKKETGEGGNL
jgi:hypothetical protein